MTRNGTLFLLIGLALLAAITQAFLPLAPSMRVGSRSNTQRSKSIGILNSMRENMNSQPNPNQVRLWMPHACGVMRLGAVWVVGAAGPDGSGPTEVVGSEETPV